MESAEYHSALAALAWQIELGADECIADAPVDRYAVPASVQKPKPAAQPAAAPVMQVGVDPVSVALGLLAAAAV